MAVSTIKNEKVCNTKHVYLGGLNGGTATIDLSEYSISAEPVMILVGTSSDNANGTDLIDGCLIVVGYGRAVILTKNDDVATHIHFSISGYTLTVTIDPEYYYGVHANLYIMKRI